MTPRLTSPRLISPRRHPYRFSFRLFLLLLVAAIVSALLTSCFPLQPLPPRPVPHMQGGLYENFHTVCPRGFAWIPGHNFPDYCGHTTNA